MSDLYAHGPAGERIMLKISASLIIVMILVVAAVPVVYDTDHFGDTLFILGAAWREHEGYMPALDFGHFYGGVVESAISFAMTLFGVQVKAIDWALILIFLAMCPALMAVCFRRVSREGAALTLLVAATLMFTRFPLENAESISRQVSTHSFTYNRLGLCLYLLVGLLVALPAATRRAEVLGSLTAGILLVVLALTKPTFVVLAPLAFLALLLQGRGTALLGCAAGVLLGALFMDPLGVRWLSSLAYAQASHNVEDGVGVVALIRKAVRVPLAHPLYIVVVLITAALVLRANPANWRRLVAVGLMTAGGLGMAATMGGQIWGLGQMAVPLFCFAMIVALELVRRRPQTEVGPIPLMTKAVVASFVIPHVFNLVGMSVEAVTHRDMLLITEGPLTGYLSNPETGIGGPDQYAMLADGLRALRDVEKVSEKGIIADNGVSFEFALQSRPVLTYPLWPRRNSPEFASDKGMLNDVDIVMLGRGQSENQEPIRDILETGLDDAFSLCRETEYWDIFVRTESVSLPCNEVLSSSMPASH